MFVQLHFRKFPDTNVRVELPFLPAVGDHINAGKRSGTVLSIAYSVELPVTEIHVEMEEN